MAQKKRQTTVYNIQHSNLKTEHHIFRKLRRSCSTCCTRRVAHVDVNPVISLFRTVTFVEKRWGCGNDDYNISVVNFDII